MDKPLVTPLVTIITPCLNAEQYLEQTIRSVLDQDYPNIEYLVMDGGSTDGTLDILKRHEGRLRWISAKDSGTADAINRGFDLTKGAIFGYLHADDLLLAGAIAAVVKALQSHPEAGGVYGEAWWIDEQGARFKRYPVRDYEPKLLEQECFICQPASFVRRDVFQDLGRLDPSLKLTFDYEFWIRFARVYRLCRMDRVLASARMHTANKSLGQKAAVFEETFGVLSRNYGYVPFSWLYASVCHRADGRDQFYEALQPSAWRYLESLPRGLSVNQRARWRYFWEWCRVMSWGGLQRQLRR